MDVRLLIALVGVVGVLAGALVTALVSLFTGYLSRRHDERRWLLDKRLEAYVAFNAALAAFHNASDGAELAALIEHRDRMLEISDTITLVAPHETSHYASRVTRLVIRLITCRVQGDSREEDFREQLTIESDALLSLQRLDVQPVGWIVRRLHLRRFAKVAGPGTELLKMNLRAGHASPAGAVVGEETAQIRSGCSAVSVRQKPRPRAARN